MIEEDKLSDITEINEEKNKNEEKKGKNNHKKIEWSPENEEIMVEWCDVAQCYKWLNNRAHISYSKQHAWYTIPAIILSTVSGTASFAQTSLPPQAQDYAPVVIGTINIFIGILTTIQQYLKISELNESHRVSSIAWDKFSRNIRIELAKKPDERLDAGTFLKHCRDEYDRLMETSPSIPDSMIKEFKRKFINTKDQNIKKRVEKLKLPDICDIIVSAEETRHHWFKDLEAREKSDLEKDAEVDILTRQKTLREQEQKMHDFEKDLETKAETISQQEQETIAKYNSLIDEYKNVFEETNGRPPTKVEILKHFDGTIKKEFMEQHIHDDGDNNI